MSWFRSSSASSSSSHEPLDEAPPPATYGMPLVGPLYGPPFYPLDYIGMPGSTPEEKESVKQAIRYQKGFQSVPESCLFKTGMAGVAGFGIGAFFSLMTASFAYEDPFRAPAMEGLNTRQKTVAMFKDMGKGMWSSGKSWGKIGALFAGIECVLEGYRAKNDIWNSIGSGFLAGAILARNAGPKAMAGGGAAFAGFSGAIDYFWLRREPADEEI